MIYKFLKRMVFRTTIFSLFLSFLGLQCLVANSLERSGNALTSITETNQAQSIFDLLSDGKEALDITIEFDMAPLMENRYNEKAQKATLSYKNTNKEIESFDIKVSLRGKYRRRVCEFPPLMIKFPKKDLRARGLNDHNDLKLVTHCIDDKLIGNDNVAKEFILYQLYNELTDNSYRVRLLKVTYKDINNNYQKIKRWAFLIEDTDEMAERLGGEECEKCLNIPTDSIDSRNENLTALFQFMIGNADWSSTMNRNLKFVNRGKNGKKLIVPYDFDFSGMVNASYAIPSSDYGLTSIKDRVFLGREVSHQIFEENIKLLLDKKRALYKIIGNFKMISPDAKTGMFDYIDTFYDIISEVDFSKQILPQLRGKGEDLSTSKGDLIINRNNSGK